MALTDTQKANVRRWGGYAAYGNSTLAPYSDPIYASDPAFSANTLSLNQKLDNLTAAEEAILIAQYLTPLASLEAALLSASDNLDTEQAAIWKANKNEVHDRTNLYNKWRRDMCHYLAIQPGRGLGDGSVKVVRC